MTLTRKHYWIIHKMKPQKNTNVSDQFSNLSTENLRELLLIGSSNEVREHKKLVLKEIEKRAAKIGVAAGFTYGNLKF